MGQGGRSGDLRIETLRGIAILGVVGNHVGLWLAKAQAEVGVPEDEVTMVTAFIAEFFAPLRMPLFTVLSGWVYALHPVAGGDAGRFFRGKFRRIVLPLLMVSLFMYFATYLVTGQHDTLPGQGQIPFNDAWRVVVFHYGHLWFLQALILLFVFVAVVDRLGWMNSITTWIFWMAVAAFTFKLLPRDIEFWSVSRAAKIFVFFIFGVGLCRFQEQLMRFPYWKHTGWLVAAGLVVDYLVQRPYWTLTVVLGCGAPLFLLSLNFVNRPLVWVGRYSYSIYLYHGLPWIFMFPFFLALAGGGSSLVWAMVFGLAGVFVPILIDRGFDKVPIVNTFLLGRKFALAKPAMGPT